MTWKQDQNRKFESVEIEFSSLTYKHQVAQEFVIDYLSESLPPPDVETRAWLSSLCYV